MLDKIKYYYDKYAVQVIAFIKQFATMDAQMPKVGAAVIAVMPIAVQFNLLNGMLGCAISLVALSELFAWFDRNKS